MRLITMSSANTGETPTHGKKPVWRPYPGTTPETVVFSVVNAHSSMVTSLERARRLGNKEREQTLLDRIKEFEKNFPSYTPYPHMEPQL